jgi:hypothetical protein
VRDNAPDSGADFVRSHFSRFLRMALAATGWCHEIGFVYSSGTAMEKASYLRKAEEFAALATEARSNDDRQVWLHMATVYMRLARRAGAVREDRGDDHDGFSGDTDSDKSH